jgi:hypothetical protein
METEILQSDICGRYMTGYGLDEKRGSSLSHARINNFLFYKMPRTTPGAHQASYEMSTGGGGVKQSESVKLTIYLQLVKMSRKRGSTHSLPYKSSWPIA